MRLEIFVLRKKKSTEKCLIEKKSWSKKMLVDFFVEIFRAVENHGASLIYCNFPSFQYFFMILDAFEAQTTGAFNAPKNIKNGQELAELCRKNRGPGL